MTVRLVRRAQVPAYTRKPAEISANSETLFSKGAGPIGPAGSKMEDNKAGACAMVLSFTIFEKMISYLVMTCSSFYRHILRHNKSKKEPNRFIVL
jgi:hypothetical protein